MTQAAALLLLYLSSTLLYGAGRERGRARHPLLATRPPARAARLAALACAGAAMWLWHRHEPGPAAALVACVGLMAMGTAVALVGPLAPTLVRRSFYLCLVAIVVLAILGAIR